MPISAKRQIDDQGAKVACHHVRANKGAQGKSESDRPEKLEHTGLGVWALWRGGK